MDGQVFYQISLVAAFVAGMVALFAPCCVSYLLPAYFGNIFREKKRIVLMTVVYSLGIFVVMLPVVLGARALSVLFFRLHDQVYVIGGVFMLLVAVLSLLGIKMPAPRIGLNRSQGGNDVFSTFTLGVFSGITSACCAPVLAGVITLSALTPTLVQSLGVGASYVLGMVAPLYLASAFIEKGNILQKPVLRKKLSVLTLGKRKYPIFVSNVVAFFIFFATGGLILILSQAGMLGMPTAESGVTKLINETAVKVTEMTGSFAGLNVVFAIAGGYLLYRFIKEAFSRKK